MEKSEIIKRIAKLCNEHGNQYLSEGIELDNGDFVCANSEKDIVLVRGHEDGLYDNATKWSVKKLETLLSDVKEFCISAIRKDAERRIREIESVCG